MSDAVKTPEGVERVDQPGDEADHLVLPSRVVDPCPEDKLCVLVFGRAGHDGDQNYQPANLKVEQGELVQGRDDLVTKHDDAGGDQVESLVDDEGLPGLDLETLLVECDEGHENLGIDQIRGSSREDPFSTVSMMRFETFDCSLTAQNTEPSSQETQNSSSSPWGDGCNPMVHAAFGWVRRDKLGQRSSEETLEGRHQDETVDDCSRTARTNLSDKTEAKTRPRDGRCRGKADETEGAEVPVELLGVTWRVLAWRLRLWYV